MPESMPSGAEQLPTEPMAERVRTDDRLACGEADGLQVVAVKTLKPDAIACEHHGLGDKENEQPHSQTLVQHVGSDARTAETEAALKPIPPVAPLLIPAAPWRQPFPSAFPGFDSSSSARRPPPRPPPPSASSARAKRPLSATLAAKDCVASKPIRPPPGATKSRKCTARLSECSQIEHEAATKLARRLQKALGLKGSHALRMFAFELVASEMPTVNLQAVLDGELKKPFLCACLPGLRKIEALVLFVLKLLTLPETLDEEQLRELSAACAPGEGANLSSIATELRPASNAIHQRARFIGAWNTEKRLLRAQRMAGHGGGGYGKAHKYAILRAASDSVDSDESPLPAEPEAPAPAPQSATTTAAGLMNNSEWDNFWNVVAGEGLRSGTSLQSCWFQTGARIELQ